MGVIFLRITVYAKLCGHH